MIREESGLDIHTKHMNTLPSTINREDLMLYPTIKSRKLRTFLLRVSRMVRIIDTYTEVLDLEEVTGVDTILRRPCVRDVQRH